MLGLIQRGFRTCRASVQRPTAASRVPSLVSRRAVRIQLRAAAEAATKTESKSKIKKEDDSDEEEDDFLDGPEVAVSTAQVQSFLSTLCGDTDIAQIELKLGGFALKVRRSVEGSADAAPAPAASAAPAPAPATPVVITTSGTGFDGISPEDSVDEALVYVTSPKVGLFRRGKYAAGKRIGKDFLVKEGDTLKKGQTVAYVEQLGTFVEIKAPQAGEIVRFTIKEGDAVEYGQVVLELAPFFGGHIIGDSKYA